MGGLNVEVCLVYLDDIIVFSTDVPIESSGAVESIVLPPVGSRIEAQTEQV